MDRRSSPVKKSERDKITMTNLDQSRVIRVGWYQTIVRGDDEQVQSVPNAKFISNKISNRSRRSHRCMKESIYLTYDVLPDCSELLEELRERLLSLPTVDARSREFRLYVKRLTQTAVEIEVEIHFRGNDGTEASAQIRSLVSISCRFTGAPTSILAECSSATRSLTPCSPSPRWSPAAERSLLCSTRSLPMLRPKRSSRRRTRPLAPHSGQHRRTVATRQLRFRAPVMTVRSCTLCVCVFRQPCVSEGAVGSLKTVRACARARFVLARLPIGYCLFCGVR